MRRLSAMVSGSETGSPATVSQDRRSRLRACDRSWFVAQSGVSRQKKKKEEGKNFFLGIGNALTGILNISKGGGEERERGKRKTI